MASSSLTELVLKFKDVIKEDGMILDEWSSLRNLKVVLIHRVVVIVCNTTMWLLRGKHMKWLPSRTVHTYK